MPPASPESPSPQCPPNLPPQRPPPVASSGVPSAPPPLFNYSNGLGLTQDNDAAPSALAAFISAWWWTFAIAGGVCLCCCLITICIMRSRRRRAASRGEAKWLHVSEEGMHSTCTPSGTEESFVSTIPANDTMGEALTAGHDTSDGRRRGRKKRRGKGGDPLWREHVNQDQAGSTVSQPPPTWMPAPSRLRQVSAAVRNNAVMSALTSRAGPRAQIGPRGWGGAAALPIGSASNAASPGPRDYGFSPGVGAPPLRVPRVQGGDGTHESHKPVMVSTSL
jgi:hypothetical protein